MIRINLLPLEYRPQPQVRFWRLMVLFAIISGTLLFIVGTYWAFAYRQSVAGEIGRIEERRLEYGATYDKVIRMEQELAVIQKKLADREKLVTGLLNPVEFFRSMEGIIPEKVAFADVKVDESHGITISGEAADYYGVAALQLKLSLSEVFGQVKLGEATESGDDQVKFSMSCVLQGGAGKP